MRVQQRRKKFSLINYANLAFVFICEVLYVLSMVLYGEGHATSFSLFSISVFFALIESVLVALLNFLALHTFVKVAKSLDKIATINYLPIIIQASLMLLWISGIIVIYITMICKNENRYDY